MRFAFIILAFSVLFFSCGENLSTDSNLKHVNTLAEMIDKDFREISSDITELANKVQIGIPFDESTNTRFDKNYSFRKNNILFTPYRKGNSAVYFPSNKTINQDVKNRIINTEKLDPLFSEIIVNNMLLEQMYFLDPNSFLRIYPYVDIENYLDESIDLTKLISYKQLENVPFNSKKAYWINTPFADPYGRGWIISCAQPIYYRESFTGIITGNISIKSIKDKYFSSNTESLFLLDNQGKLIVCTKEAGKIINAPSFKEFQYFKHVDNDIMMYSTPSLLEHQNKNLKKVIANLLKNTVYEELSINNKKYKIYRSYLPETNWYLFKIVN